jgi:hypothetical protein
MFRDLMANEAFRVLPVHFRVIGIEPDPNPDPDRPSRPRLIFAGEVRDGQTMVGRVEMTPEGHLRWKWARSFSSCAVILLTSFFRYAGSLVRPSGGTPRRLFIVWIAVADKTICVA